MRILTHILQGSFPSASRLWLYPANRHLTEKEQTIALQALTEFTQQWKAHGKPLTAGAAILEEQVLAVISNEADAAASGCSIDASVHAVEELTKKLNERMTQEGLVPLDFFTHGLTLAYLEGETHPATSFTMTEAKRAIESGEISRKTLVLNLQATTLGELKKLAAGETFLNRYFEAADAKLSASVSIA
jgi:hypothetical protein